jgi:OOP family OmpA-OmpF porin
MKRLILAAAVVTSSNVALAAQQAPAAYISVSAGSAKQEVTLAGTSGSGSANDTAFQIAGGYVIAPNVAVEVGYTNFGKAGGSEDNAAVVFKPQAVHLAITGAWRLSREFSITGKVGAAHFSTKVDASVGAAAGSETATRNALTAGVGVRYAVTPNVALTADYQHFGKTYSNHGIDVKAQIVTVGVRYSF